MHHLMQGRPGLIADYRRWAAYRKGLPTALLIVDPGGTTGLCSVTSGLTIAPDSFAQWSVDLADLPKHLDAWVSDVDAVICEDFSIHGTRGDPKAPAAIGIGMCWQACAVAGTPLFLLQPNMKKSGRQRLNQAGLDARARSKNDHERDVLDLAGKALHELRKADK